MAHLLSGDSCCRGCAVTLLHSPTWLTTTWTHTKWIDGLKLALCSAGPRSTMEWKPWTLALLLTLLNPRLHPFRDCFKGNGTLETVDVIPCNKAFCHISSSHGVLQKSLFLRYPKNPTLTSNGEGQSTQFSDNNMSEMALQISVKRIDDLINVYPYVKIK